MTRTGDPDPPGHERYCTEIEEQTRLLRRLLAGADPSVSVPTCPDWSLGDLAVHVGGAHRWAAEIVRTRATAEIAESEVPRWSGPGNDDRAALDTWLADGAAALAAALRDAGPDTAVWTWAEEQRAGFWARRMTHETVVHRADAAAATGADFPVDPELAVDTVDEWLELLHQSQHDEDEPELAELRRAAGRSIALHATDAPGDLRARWLIELGADGFDWRHAEARSDTPATVTLRAPVADVLRVFHRRLPPGSDRVEVLGDAGLLDFWLARTNFG